MTLTGWIYLANIIVTLIAIWVGILFLKAMKKLSAQDAEMLKRLEKLKEYFYAADD